MRELMRFICVGVLNTVVDLGVLNALLFVFGGGEGVQGGLYVVFKSISFLAAVTNSFFFNKYWVFAKSSSPEIKESALFLGVSVAGFLINVGVSAAAFFIFADILEVSSSLAVNAGALFGSGAVLLSNFLGYKFVVFKKTV
ncbi:MAG: GtrA family protein [bacterium]|nr:GtrA family protein [bacterium]